MNETNTHVKLMNSIKYELGFFFFNGYLFNLKLLFFFFKTLAFLKKLIN